MADNISIKDRARHAADIAKFKVDQTKRVMYVNNQINEAQGQVRSQKSKLAELTFNLYKSNELHEESLIAICENIDKLYSNILDLEAQRESIKNAQPPNIENYIYQDTNQIPENFSGLVCPVCQRPLRGRFCPVHGKEGVAKDRVDPETISVSNSGPLICPICSKPLKGQYCPQHGVKGVERNPDEPMDNSGTIQ